MARYPLEPLRSLREAAVDDGARQLGEKARRTAAAERHAAQSQRSLLEREAQHRGIEASEQQRLASGSAQVADLAAEATWRVAASRIEDELWDQVSRAEEQLATQRREEDRARQLLAQRRAEARLVERHHQAWSEEAERRAELERDEDATDGWTNAHARRRRGGP